jgi:predicted phage terminase large subunit-like protein
LALFLYLKGGGDLDELATLDLINILLEQRDLKMFQNLSDFFELLRIYETEDKEHAHKLNKLVRDICTHQAKKKLLPFSEQEKFYHLYKNSLLFDAYDDFDAFLLYIEFDREPEKKFYVPRRKLMKDALVQYLQDLEDDKLDILTISMPPGTGKSTLGIFYLSWLMGRHPNMCNLASGHADGLTRGFFDGVLSIIEDPEYLWHDVFPNVKLADKSSKYETIDLNSIKRFPSLTCRAIGGSLTGATRCEGILYVDDLVSGIEEALSKDRMDTLWMKYFNDLKSRKKMHCKELHIATRWSVHDPIGRLERENEGNPRAKFICIPALDENGESNFDYDFGVGFNTAYFQNLKENMDEVSFLALYMNQPIEREGLLFPEKELRYWNGVLPPTQPDAIYSVSDVAWGGGDSYSQPFAYQYGDTIYITDWIFDKGDKTVTRPRVIGKMAHHKPHLSKFEANNGGHEYSDKVDEELRKVGVHLNITSEISPSNKSKLSRIIRWAPDIKKFVFLDKQHRSKEYDKAMQELTTFLQTGKSPHDDSPDSLAMLAELIYEGGTSYEISERPF